MRFATKEEGHLPGMTYPYGIIPEGRIGAGMVVQPVHWRDDPECSEEWADRESAKYGGRDSPEWRQNHEIELVRGGAPVWGMLREQVHVRDMAPSEYLSANWAVWRSLDHGMRHPTCCAWCAVHKNGDRYFFRQYYVRNVPIPVAAKQILELDGLDEEIFGTVADPSIWQRSPTSMELESFAELYAKHGLPLIKADNHRSGYITLRTGFLSSLARWALGRRNVSYIRDALRAPTLSVGDVERMAAQPAIWFHPSCSGMAESLYEQCANLRYRPDTNLAHRAESELPEDKEDEGPDVVRYACHSKVVTWRRPQAPARRDLIGELISKTRAAKRAAEARGPTW